MICPVFIVSLSLHLLSHSSTSQLILPVDVVEFECLCKAWMSDVQHIVVMHSPVQAGRVGRNSCHGSQVGSYGRRAERGSGAVPCPQPLISWFRLRRSSPSCPRFQLNRPSNVRCSWNTSSPNTRPQPGCVTDPLALLFMQRPVQIRSHLQVFHHRKCCCRRPGGQLGGGSTSVFLFPSPVESTWRQSLTLLMPSSSG